MVHERNITDDKPKYDETLGCVVSDVIRNYSILCEVYEAHYLLHRDSYF